MKHLVVALVLIVSIAWLATRKTALDRLMVVAPTFSAEQTGDRYVDLPSGQLPITPESLAVPGVITIVYFHDETCHGCLKLDQDLVDFLQIRPDVAVRKVRISLNGDAYYQAIKQYRWKIYAAPCILIFGRDGTLVAADEKLGSDGQDLLEAWIRKEFERVGSRPSPPKANLVEPI